MGPQKGLWASIQVPSLNPKPETLNSRTDEEGLQKTGHPKRLSASYLQFASGHQILQCGSYDEGTTSRSMGGHMSVLYVYIYICIYIHTYMDMNIYKYMCIYIYTYIGIHGLASTLICTS